MSPDRESRAAAAVVDVVARRRWRTAVAGAVLGAVCWGGWLAWDTSASYDVVTGQVEAPYVTLQVLGCALSVGLVSAVLGALGNPLAAAAGVSVGFWVGWTAQALSGDDTGLAGVGALLLAVGLGAGTGLAAWVGVGARHVLRALRGRGVRGVR